jgi:hypothetical protein
MAFRWRHRSRAALLPALWLLLPACPGNQPPPAAPAPAGMGLLRRVEGALASADPSAVAGLLTPRCRAACRGLMPHPLPSGGGYHAALWLPAPGGRGALPQTLVRLLRTYGRIRRASLSPRQMLAWGGGLRVRATLRLAGRDLRGTPRVDQGLLDLTLERRRGRWRIDDLRAARLWTVWREQPGYRVPGAAQDAAGAAGAAIDLAVPGRLFRAPWRVLDLEGDGRLELVTVADGGLVATASGGGEERVLVRRGTLKRARVLAGGDFDGDGRLDLFIGLYGGQSRIWTAADGGYRPLPGFGVRGQVTAALAADFDDDGRLDLYVVRHAPPGARVWQPGQPNQLFLGRPGRAPVAAGWAADRGWGLGACGADLDLDGDVDLLVVNEQGPSRLWLNRGRGRGLSDASERVGLRIPGQASACAVGDADGDGRLDLFVARRPARQGYLFGRPGLGHPADRLPLPSRQRRRRLEALAGGSLLLLNRPRPGGGFWLRPQTLPVAGWEAWAGLLDHDADGDLDLLGRVRRPDPQAERRWWWEVVGPALWERGPASLAAPLPPLRGRLLLNLGPRQAGGWVAGAGLAGLPGDLAPLAVVPRQSPVGLALQLPGRTQAPWQGSPDHGHAVLVRLLPGGDGRQRGVVGALVRLQVESDGPTQLRQAGLASGLPDGPPGYLHFGVGDAVRVARITVDWPGGPRRRYPDLPVDQLLRLGRDGSARWPGQEQTGAPAAATAGESGPGPLDRLVAAPLRLTVLDRGGRGEVPLSTAAGRVATVVLLLPARPAGPPLAAACARLARVTGRHPGVRAVLVLPPGGPAPRCGLPLYRATARTAHQLEAIQLLLPLTLLVDASGTAAMVVSGVAGEARLEAGLRSLMQATRRSP